MCDVVHENWSILKFKLFSEKSGFYEKKCHLSSKFQDMFLRFGNRKAFTDRASVRDNRPPVEIIEKIKVPTLILWGAEDTRISPENAYEFHQKIKKAVLKIYRNTGHWPQEENPSQSAKDVKDFLEGNF